MEKICGFITGFKIQDELNTKQRLKKVIDKQIFKGDYIFVINPTDKFNNLALDVCRQVKLELPFVQIFYNNNDYALHDLNILFCGYDLTEDEKTNLPYKPSEFINIFDTQRDGLYEINNLSKYISPFTLK